LPAPLRWKSCVDCLAVSRIASHSFLVMQIFFVNLDPVGTLRLQIFFSPSIALSTLATIAGFETIVVSVFGALTCVSVFLGVVEVAQAETARIDIEIKPVFIIFIIVIPK